ncbi:MAG TPA: hypothetical protein ACFYEC_05425 [Candidatus Brocadiaceae bacterium]
MTERQLVKEAAVNPAAREQLKKELLPYVVLATKELMKSRGIPEEREQELIDVGIAPFDRVFNIYLKNASGRHEEEGFFYKYYLWWMRKAIFEYLHAKFVNHPDK